MIRAIALGLAVLACAAAGASAALGATPLCSKSSAAAPALERLRAALAHGRFVAYEPSALAVVNGQFKSADAASIRADLATLRPRFDSLVTYDAIHGAEHIPPIAAALGYRALIIGVWNPFADAEVDAALDAARRYPQLVAGISLGNELIFNHRSDAPALGRAIARLRSRQPQTPLSITEPFHMYFAGAAPGGDAAGLLGELDFLLANVHPIFQSWFRSAPESTSAQFVVNVVDELAGRYCGPILVKETGLPSAPASAGFTPERQAAFYLELRRRFTPTAERAFAYFAAFDAPWRERDASTVPHPEEAHWGLFDAARRAKPAAEELPQLSAVPVPP